MFTSDISFLLFPVLSACERKDRKDGIVHVFLQGMALQFPCLLIAHRKAFLHLPCQAMLLP